MARTIIGIALTGVLLTVLVVGCSKTEPMPTAAVAKAKGHEHQPGAHGGQIVEIGRDNYHAEVVLEQGGKLRLFTLGRDAARIQEVARAPLSAFVKKAGADAQSLTLQPEPQAGDREGMTSAFAVQLPADLRGVELNVTVPNLTIGDERFRVSFTLASHGQESLPPKVRDRAEEELYLTPGGKYTAADIKANGHVTASAKFEGIPSTHDIRPSPGDPLCPITKTKANPKFTWVVGGETYQFCCPPCVDEFLQKAKEHPEEIRPPAEYRNK
jgi:hypothetical protein